MNSDEVEIVGRYRQQLIDSIAKLQSSYIVEVIKLLDKARMIGGRVYTFGNGGSGSTASHFASDLNKGARRNDKPPFKAVCLNDNMPLLTAWGNDTHYGMVFQEPLDNFVEKGDVIVAISGSGNSPNVINAVKLAMARGAGTIGLTGFDGGQLKKEVDVPIIVPSNIMEQVEDVHLILCHVIAYTLSIN